MVTRQNKHRTFHHLQAEPAQRLGSFFSVSLFFYSQVLCAQCIPANRYLGIGDMLSPESVARNRNTTSHPRKKA